MDRKLTDQELRLWRRVARTIQPIRTFPLPDDEPGNGQSEPGPAPTRRPLSSARAAPAKSIERNPPGLAAQDQSGHRRVRRGRLAIDATLDLHGHTQQTARRALQAFVHQRHEAGDRCLLVITGKGRAGASVLRQRFLDWINDPEIRFAVAGYAPANARHGGDGAYYLLLKRPAD